MQVLRNLIIILFFTISSNAFSAIVSSKGAGSSNFGFRLNAENRAEALRNAKINSLENYIAESEQAKLKLFEARRGEFISDIDRYVLSSVIISENENKDSKTYQVFIRSEINSNLLQVKLDAGSSASSTKSSEASLLAFIFVARSQDSVQSFDDRVFKKAEAKSNAKSKGKQTDTFNEKTSEGESFSNSSISTSGTRKITQNQDNSLDEKLSISLETGGSTTKKAEKVSWKVSNASEVNTVVTGLFSRAGYEVAEAEYIPGIDLQKIRSDFGKGNDLSQATLIGAANGSRAADVKYLAYGTLDVGVRDTDPVTGNTRIFVTVTGKVLDVSRQIPRTISSVGPVQFAGLGPNETVARTNALQEAATKAAQQMSNELNVKSVN